MELINNISQIVRRIKGIFCYKLQQTVKYIEFYVKTTFVHSQKKCINDSKYVMNDLKDLKKLLKLKFTVFHCHLSNSWSIVVLLHQNVHVIMVYRFLLDVVYFAIFVHEKM